jgi:hypothetical protein
VLQDEFTQWVMHDKHAEAFSVLANKQSRQIASNLAVGDPWEEPRCLACHTNPLTVATKDRARNPMHAQVLREERASGVGCEACHGAASRWLEPHKKAGWRENKDRKELDDLGWKFLDNIGVRAKTCARCHVGAAPSKDLPIARDVNHDLIAAGHPRLNFEFASFMANMPPHWQTTTAERQGTKEAQVWAVGQVASAEAALELLAFRAQPGEHKPWLEFAAYDCFACHHDLREPSWRQTTQHYGKRLPGSLPWETWYYTMLQPLANEQPGAAPRVSTFLDPLAKTLELPLPPRNTVARAAASAAQQLKAWRKRLTRKEALTKLDSTFAQKMLVALAETDERFARAGWDGAEQFFLAALALKQAQGEPGFLQKHGKLAERRARLLDSPGDFDPMRFCADLRKSLGVAPKRRNP